jgi:hypothetical protein
VSPGWPQRRYQGLWPVGIEQVNGSRNLIQRSRKTMRLSACRAVAGGLPCRPRRWGNPSAVGEGGSPQSPRHEEAVRRRLESNRTTRFAVGLGVRRLRPPNTVRRFAAGRKGAAGRPEAPWPEARTGILRDRRAGLHGRRVSRLVPSRQKEGADWKVATAARLRRTEGSHRRRLRPTALPTGVGSPARFQLG